jgi:hypothetical protein
MFERKSKSKSAKTRKPSTLSILPRFIPLVIKLGFVYLSFKRKAKKAGKIFKKELIACGLDKETAERLTKEYLKGSHILRGFDFSDLASG